MLSPSSQVAPESPADVAVRVRHRCPPINDDSRAFFNGKTDDGTRRGSIDRCIIMRKRGVKHSRQRLRTYYQHHHHHLDRRRRGAAMTRTLTGRGFCHHLGATKRQRVTLAPTLATARRGKTPDRMASVVPGPFLDGFGPVCNCRAGRFLQRFA